MKYGNIEEAIRAAANGEREAFGVVVEKYQSLICAIAMGATGDLEKSEELAQRVFVKAWEGLGGLKDTAKFKSWVCSIARNEANNHIRSEKRAGHGKAVHMDIDSMISNENGE